jgi:hypothetical protein
MTMNRWVVVLLLLLWPGLAYGQRYNSSGEQMVEFATDTVGLALDTSVDGVEALLTTIDADTGTIVGAISGTEFQVDVIVFPDNEPFNLNQVGGIAVTAGAGAVAAGTLRVTLASDDPAVTSLQKIDNVAHSGSDVALVEHVPVSAQLDDTATTSVTENQLAPLRINSSRHLLVDVATVSAAGSVDDTDTLTPATTEGTPMMGAATPGDSVDSGDLGILAMDVDRALHVSDGGNTLTVDGTVTADLGATDNAVLDDIANGIPLDANSGVDIGDVDVTSSALPTGASTLAEQQTQTTALQLIADAVYVDDADWTDSTSKHALVGGLYQSSPQSITDGDVGPLSLTSNGALRVSGGGGGTEYTVNAVAPADPTGATFTMERDDEITSLTEIEGDWTNPRSSAEGALWTQDFNSDAILTAVGNLETYTDDLEGYASGTEVAVELIDDAVFADDALFTLATSKTMVAGAIRDAALTTLAAGDTDVVPFRVGLEGALWTEIYAMPAVTIGTFPDNEPIDVNQLGGNAVDLGNGTVGSGTLRVTVASDTTGVLSVDDNGAALTVDGTVTADLGATDNAVLDDIANGIPLDANSGVDIGDVDVTSLPNEGQQTAANSISVTPDTDNDPIGAPASTIPGEAVYVGGTDGTNLAGFYVDPCQREAKTYFPVDIVTATTTEIANAVASEFFYICSISLVTASANNVAIVEDDTDACASPTAGVNGGVTAAEGWNFAANGGLTQGNGQGAIMKTGTANRYLCIITSAAVQLSGTITYVSAP